MAAEAKISGELAGLIFQAEEIIDDVQDFTALDLNELQTAFEELKAIRINMVKVHTELTNVRGENDSDKSSQTDTHVKQLLVSAKQMMAALKHTINSRERKRESDSYEHQDAMTSNNLAEKKSRKFAFDAIIMEMNNISNALLKKYDVDSDTEENLTKDIVLQRKDSKSSLTTEHARLKSLVDRALGYTDVLFDGKDAVLKSMLSSVMEIEERKEAFERKLFKDVNDFDVSDQKLKLATLTKVDIGKFSGSLDKGVDFYTFKSKFLKAYVNHPKSLLVEWLVNNHLEGRAKDCVGSLKNLDEIWTRLQNSFGNVEQLLTHQFKKISQLGLMNKQKTFDLKMHFTQRLVNIMQDVYDLAVEHALVNHLHYGNHLLKVVSILEKELQTKWYEIVASENVGLELRWNRMREFLESELKVYQIRASECSENDTEKKVEKGDDKKVNPKNSSFHVTEVCKLCDEKHHSSNTSFVQCKKFLQLPIKERWKLVRKNKYCLQCLDGKTKWMNPNHVCSDKWICKDSFHDKFTKKNHFLICEQHSDNAANKELYEHFKTEVLKADWQKQLHPSIYISEHTSHDKNNSVNSCESSDGVDDNSAAYILQPFPFNNRMFSLMFDTGCQKFVSRSDAVDALPETHRTNTKPGPIIISGVGCQQVISKRGEFTVKLPAYNGKLVAFNGICLDVITGVMPPYPVREARRFIVADYVAQGGKESDLPQVPITTGGQTDFLIGLQYNFYQPRLVHILPTGLAIYKSMFVGVGGARGCIGGSHELFSQCEQQFCNNFAQFKAFLTQQLELFNSGFRVCLDCSAFSSITDQSSELYAVKTLTSFDDDDDDTSKTNKNVVGGVTMEPLSGGRSVCGSNLIDSNTLCAGNAAVNLMNPVSVADISGILTDELSVTKSTVVPELIETSPAGGKAPRVTEPMSVGNDLKDTSIEELLPTTEHISKTTEMLSVVCTVVSRLMEDSPAGDLDAVTTASVQNAALAEYGEDRYNIIQRPVVIVNEDNVDGNDHVLLSSKVKLFEEVDTAGSSIEYRCPNCRGCSKCRMGDFIESVSFKDEREQCLIDSSVDVDFIQKETSAFLPFILNPEEKLLPNRDIAMKVYRQQLKRLSKDPKLREAVIQSEFKLQTKGHVDWISNLSVEEQNMLNEGADYFIPWRFVQNDNSLSTPVRPVFDASSVTRSGFSLNDLLAKGINSMNSLLEIFIRFRFYPVGIHTDIKQMYNVIKLHPKHWKFQKYLFDPELREDKEPSEKVIKTLIYGVKSSANQAECGLRRTALEQQERFPEASRSVISDTYVDDCATGCKNHAEAEQLSADLIELLSYGGFSTKGFTIAGKPPLSSLSKDGVSVNVAGSKWHSEADKIQLAVEALNFSKKNRGKKAIDENSWVIPENLTRRICAGKVAEVFDLVGLVAPIIAGLKIDLHELVISLLGWDDVLKACDRDLWVENFRIIESLGNLLWNRVLVPADAVNLEMQIIGTGDASAKMACAAVYVRFLKKDGSYSCQLALAKTKIIDGITLPRAELLAAKLNTHTSEVVKRSLKDYVKSKIHVLDSEIALHWLASETKRLKPGVRNAVIEVLRFTTIEEWFHISSQDNPADLGTRKGVSISEVDADSEWINGKRSWMTKPLTDLVGDSLKNIDDVKLKNEQISEMKREFAKPQSDLCKSDFTLLVQKTSINASTDRPVLSGSENLVLIAHDNTADAISPLATVIRERLQFSRYLIDPNKYRFSKVVRINTIVMKFCHCALRTIGRDLKCLQISDVTKFATDVNKKKNIPSNSLSSSYLQITDLEVQCSLDYFYRKGTEELKSFAHPRLYEKDSYEKNKIIYYAGRVYNNDISFQTCDITEKMIDLSILTFIVPIIDRNSPLAYAIVNQVHWYDKAVMHSGVETTIRAISTIAHILNVRDIVKRFRKSCRRCRYILKRTVDVAMGPASEHQLCIAPPFYVAQVDLCGSYLAFSIHNKRATVKVYIAVFVCCTTGTTSLKVMDGYDTAQFLSAFTRFACELGFPKLLLIDEGSQLVSGCEKVVLNMVDVKGRLNREYGIEFNTCPVEGHNFNGKVERKVQTVKETIDKTMHNCRLSILEWETLCSEMSNSINNLPVAIGNETDELENLDLITPNRLRLARNNNRSPVGPLEVTGKIERLLQLKTEAFQAWWEAWLVSALPKLMPKPKWFRSDQHLKKGDVVIFNKDDGYKGAYKYAMVDDVIHGRDGAIRSVVLKYRNANEGVSRTTHRAVRSLTVIHRIDEINLMEELGKAAVYVDGYYCRQIQSLS